MTAQIRPNRMEVSDRFPMLGFAVRVDEPNVEAEVVLANDIALFGPQGRTRRTAANFYSSQEHGTLTVPRGDGVFVVAPEVLARFIGSEKLYFGLATGHAGNGGLQVDALPREGSPYVSLRGFTGRTLRRSFGSSHHGAPRLEWTGDAARPGSENAAPARNGANGNGNGNGEQRRETERRSNGNEGGGGTAVASRPAPAPAKSGSDRDYDDGFGPMPEIPARESAFRGAPQERGQAPRADPASSAMVFGAEDIEKARRYARDFRDLFQWSCPASIVSEISARGFTVQTIESAVGDLNLDFYKVDITRFPSGWDGPRLLNHFMRNINDFLDTGNTEFIPYADSDRQRLASATPLGTVFKLDVVGPDNAAVVISDVQDRYFAVTTINTPDTGDHPVSGHRMFGYAIEEGKTVWFTRAADRPTLMPSGLQEIIFAGADALWKSMQRKMAAFINDNGGSATVVSPPFSERFNPTAVRLEVGKFDGAQGLSADVSSGGEVSSGGDASPAIVRPVLPGDQRARAGRIGGAFAGRLGEALDLGLAPKALDALLDTLDPPPAAQPLSYARSADRAKAPPAAEAMGGSPWTINWDGVTLIPQPTNESCWATTGSMLVNWRDGSSTSPATIARQCGMTVNDGLDGGKVQAIANALRLESVPPQCYAPEGFRSLLASNGPLYVVKLFEPPVYSGHAVLVTGMYFDGTNHFVRVTDPWDRPVGSPGAPGAYPRTHATGSRYIMRYEDFQSEYEMAMNGDPANVQILHAGGAHGHIPNTGAFGAPPGYAMDAPPKTRRGMDAPPKTARGMDAGAIASIAGTAITLIAGNTGDITWSVPQWPGLKHPNDVAPATQDPYHENIIMLDKWPKVGGTFGIDDIYAWFRIRWQYNGTSLGRVYVEQRASDDAAGWSLAVTGTIEDDSRLYPRNDSGPTNGPDQVPALHVVLNYVFDEIIADSHIATSRISLYADGTHEIDSEWLQHARPFPDKPRDVARTS